MTKNRIRAFGTVGGITQSPNGLNAGVGSNVSPIKSIQNGETYISLDDSIDVTISSVDITKTVVRCNTRPLSSVTIQATHSIELINSTTIRITRYGAGSSASYVYWDVTEYSSLKSKQTGSYTLENTSSNVSITTVNLSKTLLIYSYYDAVSVTTFVNGVVGATFLNNSTLTFTQYASNSKVIKWQVIEFN